jgi:DNA invertase Pin-like site-specific DNA recombinase
MRAAIYTRISQDSTGQRAGVTRQLKDCKALARRLKWQVVATYDDNDISAFNGKTRPGFENLLDAIKRGEIDAIICWHPDRLYRRVKDLERVVEIADQGVQIVSVNGGEVDLSNSTGKMMARILGSVAQQESEHKGERRRAANADRAAHGSFRSDGPRQFGYTQRGEPLEPEATALRAAVRDILDGRSLRSVCREWNANGLFTPKAANSDKRKGGAKWTNPQLRRVLMRPVYAGLRTYGNAKPVAGDWEALIDVDTHRGLVAFLSDPDRTPASSFERKHLLSGVAVCGVCGARLYALRPGKDRAHVYTCRESAGKHAGRLAEPLDALVEATVLALLRDSDIHRRLVDRPGVDAGALHARRTALAARKGELAALFAEGVLDGPAVRRESAKLAEQIAGIDKTLADVVRTSPAAAIAADGPDKLQQRWDSASPDIRGKVIDELMTVTVLPTPRGVRGVRIDRDTGARVVNLDYVKIAPR